MESLSNESPEAKLCAEKEEDSDNEQNHIIGDIIGNTAYSERYVLNILMKLLKVDEIDDLEEFIEKDLCTVWNMTTEKDVAVFLLGHNVIEIIFGILLKNENVRLTEVIIGISANMCCYEIVIREFSKNDDINNTILSYLNSDDSLIVIQVLRFIFSNVYYDTNIDQWLQYFLDNKISPAITFILSNSVNEEVLINCFETINCICLAYNEKCNKDKFISLFVQNEFIQSTLVGFEELMKCFVMPTSDESTIERCDVVFLAMHSILVGFKDHSYEIYSSELKQLLIIMKNIIDKNFDNLNTLIDIMEYTTSIISGLKCPTTDDSTDILKSVIRIWKVITPTNDLPHTKNYDSADIIELTEVLPQYFVRMINALHKDTTKSMLNSMDSNHLTHLCETIENLIQSEKMDKYFEKISEIVKELCLNKLQA